MHAGLTDVAGGAGAERQETKVPLAGFAEVLAWTRGRVAARWIAAAAATLGLGTGLVLAFEYVTLGGPGDQLRYYDQAAHFFPFTDNWYGPSYFLALRLVHDLFRIDWFTSGKVIGFASACAFLYLTVLLLRRALPDSVSWLAIALVALNPELISESYSTMTVLYGAVWTLAAITVITGQPPERRGAWLGGGLLFGLAGLSRTQALGFLIGAIAGTLFLQVTWRARLRCAGLLAIGAALPLLAWNGLLLAVQGYTPRNYNFIHLTYALGQFPDFFVWQDLVTRYGSMWGVIRANPWNLPRIVAFGTAQLAGFPFREGLEILGPAAFWLVPGGIVAFLTRRTYAPWVIAFVMGLFLTGVAARGWTFYYIPVLPLLAYLITIGVEAFGTGGERSGLVRQLAWGVVLCGAVGWAAIRVPKAFRNVEWPEWAAARQYLNRRADSSMVASSTAASLQYQAHFRFIDFDDVMHGHELPSFVDSLRAHGITRLVVEERHMVPKYPSLARLLDDSVPDLPSGLVRDTLIVHPRRLAIYEIVP